MRFSRKLFSKRMLRRYGRYHLFFYLALLLFLATLVSGWILWERNLFSVELSGVDGNRLFASVFSRGVTFYLLCFLCGVTLYAPAFLVVSSLIRGLSAGAILAGLFTAVGFGGLGVFFLTLLQLLFSALLFFTYSAFCTSVSLRLFTDRPLSPKREEERMFGGSLFSSEYFQNTVNLRFLSMYLLLFLAALLLAALTAFSYSFLRGLFS